MKDKHKTRNTTMKTKAGLTRTLQKQTFHIIGQDLFCVLTKRYLSVLLVSSNSPINTLLQIDVKVDIDEHLQY